MNRTADPDGTAAVTVLLVEDHSALRTALAMALELAGFRVFAESGAVGAVKRFVEVPPDVAVLDIGLDGAAGTELAGALRSLAGGSIPVVWISGDPDRAERAKRPGDVILPKPFGPAALIAAVRGILTPPSASHGHPESA